MCNSVISVRKKVRESAWGRESFIYEAVLVRFRDEIYRVTTMKIDFRVQGF